MFKSLGKYSVIIVTTALFLILVLSVLGLNFYMSFQVESNAESVNVAGRQRMLSQRISKSLLNTQAQIVANSDYNKSLGELKSATSMFNTTLQAFQVGGEITSTKGEKSYLPKVTTDRARQAIAEANSIWQPFHQEILNTISVLESSSASALPLLNKNTEYARENINSVLKLMNDLTNEQESIANKAANLSRQIQAFGIIAALLCFMIIMYRIFGQLRKADAKTEAAERETQQIFDTVNQGLFLLDDDYNMGQQHSHELVNIFGQNDISNRSFTNFIRTVVSSNDLDNVKRYMKLLFDPHKKEKLIADLNPLNEVSIQVKKDNTITNKFVRFNFMRVQNDDEIESVLTSVSDITKEVQLARDLEKESKRSEQQLEMISAMLEADQKLMPVYLTDTHNALTQINELLRNPSRTTKEFQDKAKSMMTIIHGVKGESSALALNNIADMCHEFETHLSGIIKNENVDGHNFVEPTVLLNKLLSYNTKLQELFNNVFGHRKAAVSNNAVNWDHLTTYANDVAARQNKKVNVKLSGLNAPDLSSELISGINTISTQLIRNAISHGIETGSERALTKKARKGEISIALFDSPDNEYSYLFHDDGRGINFAKLTEQAVRNNLLSEQEAKTISKQKIMNLMFSSDLSTAEKVDEDKGRGIGMAAVLQTVRELNGTISVKTNKLSGTSFIINFPKQAPVEQLHAIVA